jgi:acetoin utilization deacetylase AcuC-like enzyme
MKIFTDERCLSYGMAHHPEKPSRVRNSVRKLTNQRDIPIQWVKPEPVGDDILSRAHTREHIKRVRETKLDFAGDTPAYPDIFEHAMRSSAGAVRAMEAARKGEIAFSLLRPPGHHAKKEEAMGFCYFNSVAVSVLEALAMGAKKVAVFDFDVHHGNGTEAILVNHWHTAFFSVHQHPCYPGTGITDIGHNCFNFPVAPKSSRKQYRHVLTRSWLDLEKFKPDLVAISAGFDAYRLDNIAQENLEPEDFYSIGAMIRRSGIPAYHVLEGGYSDDLPELILAYLKGLTDK